MEPQRLDRPNASGASATTLSITVTHTAPIRVLRARKPLRYPGYPGDLERPLDRLVPAVLLVVAAAYWFATTPSAASFAAG